MAKQIQLFGIKLQGLIVFAVVAVVVIMLVNRVDFLRKLVLGKG